MSEFTGTGARDTMDKVKQVKNVAKSYYDMANGKPEKKSTLTEERRAELKSELKKMRKKSEKRRALMEERRDERRSRIRRELMNEDEEESPRSRLKKLREQRESKKSPYRSRYVRKLMEMYHDDDDMDDDMDFDLDEMDDLDDVNDMDDNEGYPVYERRMRMRESRHRARRHSMGESRRARGRSVREDVSAERKKKRRRG